MRLFSEATRLANVGAVATLLTLSGSPLGCLELPRPREAAPSLEPVAVEARSLSVESSCVPTGVERCFDALDDNCNGIIDEGCGLQTGLLQFAIAWSEPVDVDLRVEGPDATVADTAHASPVGLLKDRDCKGTSDCHGQNVENVFLAEGWPRRGRYKVSVRLEDARSEELPIRVRLSARIGQRVLTGVVLLEERREEKGFEFTL